MASIQRSFGARFDANSFVDASNLADIYTGVNRSYILSIENFGSFVRLALANETDKSFLYHDYGSQFGFFDADIGAYRIDFSDNVGNVILAGGDAGDIILSGSGNDSLSGGRGNDVLDAGTGNNTIDGGDGINTLRFESYNLGIQLSGVFVDLASRQAISLDAVSLFETFSNIQNIVGTNRMDILTGDGINNTIRGGAGADTIDGGGGVDIASYAGSSGAVTIDLVTGSAIGGDAQGDTLNNIEGLIGSAYGDTLAGNNGNNLLVGGGGNDTLQGLAGDDRLVISDVPLFVDGGNDFDTLNIAARSGTLVVDADTIVNVERVTVSDGSGIDLSAFTQAVAPIFSRSSTDAAVAIVGTQGGDRVVGGLGADSLNGGAGDDRIIGGAGDNIITGGEGRDFVMGGGGSDRFVFASVADLDAGGRDRILDFSGVDGDHDTIDLTGIADFTFIGAGEFSGSGTAQLRTLSFSLGYRLQGDIDGDGTADFTFQVVTNAKLSADDFFTARPTFALANTAPFSPAMGAETTGMLHPHLASAELHLADHTLLV